MRHRRHNVVLVEVDGQYVLLNQQCGMIHIVNESGAWVWAHLTDDTLPEGCETFVASLRELDLLGDDSSSVETVAQFTSAPAVISSAPLVVAAANCPNTGDPFFEGP